MQQRVSETLRGFDPPFWVANVSEIFERLAYYTVFSSLALYLNHTLGFSMAQAAGLSGVFGGAVWVMAIFGGALADRIGFRRALSTAYLILTLAYFLVGSIGAAWLAPVRAVVPLPWLAGIILFLPALGVALVKPSVVGTTARASRSDVRSIGYSIYYTLVNIGSTLGPFVAGWIHGRLPPQDAFLVAAVSVFAMFLVVLIFFREPRADAARSSRSLKQTATDFVTVASNGRFVLFLLIFSGYWIVYWQQFLILPIYLNDYVDSHANTAVILATDPLIVIALTVAVNAATRSMRPFRALVIGTLVTSLGWLPLALHGSVMVAVLSLAIIAIGEIIQSPRYYEYISRLAPDGQQGTYMGFAFLPIGIGSIVGGVYGGALLNAAQKLHPQTTWLIVALTGVFTSVLLWLYDRFMLRSKASAAA